MRNLTLLLLFTFSTSTLVFGQEYLSPLNNPANKTLLKPEITKMQWFMLKDSLKIPIGTIETQIQKKRTENIRDNYSRNETVTYKMGGQYHS